MAPKAGRCAILIRQEEAANPRKQVEANAIEHVLGLGPNLFYNSPICLGSPAWSRWQISGPKRET